MSRPRRVALALGSGGARGYAHIGVAQVLEERGFEVVAVAGASMGALVGGVMAAGRLKEFTDWAVSLKQRDVLRLIDPKWALPGAMAADRLINHLNEFLGDVEIERLPIPYTAVATDIAARREVWFQRGPLRPAIRASIAIPGVITPVVVNGRLLADGGLLNPVPLEPTAAAGADLTVAVSLQAPRPPHEPAGPVRTTAEPQWFEDWRERLRQVFQGWTARAAVAAKPLLPVVEPPPAQPGIARAGDAEAESGAAGAGAPARPGEPTRPDAAGANPAGSGPGRTEPDLTPATPATPDDPASRSLTVAEPFPAIESALPADLRIADVLGLSLDAMQDLITRYRMAGLPPDIHITIPVSASRVMDFHRAAEMIAMGRALTTKALDDAGY